MTLTNIFNGCLSGSLTITGQNANLFQSTDNFVLSLVPGAILTAGQTYHVILTTSSCTNPCFNPNSCLVTKQCSIPYTFGVGSVGAPTRNAHINYFVIC